MLATTPCPDARQWHQLLLGHLSGPDADALEHHLSDCGACLQTVRGLPARDDLADALQTLPRTEQTAPDTLRNLMVRLKSQRPPLESPRAETVTDMGIVGTPAPDGKAGDEGTQEAAAFLAPPQAPDEMGRLGSYRVLKLLGAGGMGMVFLAEDTALRRLVALKAMRPTLAASATARARFLREARATAALDHDHIVHIYQVAEERGVPYLAMQLLRGKTLEDRLRQYPHLPIAEILRIGREIAEGLAGAHATGLIHRDIKPSNIWLEGDRGRVKLLDFGLARGVDDDERLTSPGVVAGTPAYMAPEQARDEDVDARSDLFSLGCVLYRMCTGEVPFKGPGAMGTLLALATHTARPPRDVNGAVPAALSDLVLRLLAKDPKGRPDSAAGVAGELARIGAEPAGSDAVTLEVPAAPRRRKRQWLLVAVAAAMLLPLAVWPTAQVIINLYDKEGKKVGQMELPEGWRAEIETKKSDSKTDPKTGPATGSKTGSQSGTGTHHDTGTRTHSDTGTGTHSNTSPRTDTKTNTSTHPRTDTKTDIVKDPKTKPARGLDHLDPAGIPAEDVFPWQPKELVAVLGEHRQRHWGPVLSVSLAPDGKLFASGSLGDYRVLLCDAAAGHTLKTYGKSPHGRLVAFHPAGKLLASTEAATIPMLDVTTRPPRQVSVLKLKEVPLTMAFSPDGKLLVVGMPSGTVQLFDLSGPPTGEGQVFKAHATSTVFVGSDPGRKRLITASAPEVTVWDLANGEPRPLFTIKIEKGAFGFRSGALAPDGSKLVMISTNNLVRLYDLTGDKAPEAVMIKGIEAYSAAFSPRNGNAVLAEYRGKPASVWDMSGEPKKLATLPPESAWVSCLALTPDGKMLLTGCFDGAFRLWDWHEGNYRERLPLNGPTGAITALSFTPGDDTLVSAGADGVARFWDLTNARPALRSSSRMSRILHLATAGGQILLAPRGRPQAAAVGVAPDQVFDLSGPIAVDRPLKGPVARAAFAWDNTLAVQISGEQGAIQLLDLGSQNLVSLGQLKGNDYSQPFATSADGRKLAANADGGKQIRIWDLKVPAKATYADVPSETKGGKLLAFTADGKTLLAGSEGFQLIDLTASPPMTRQVIKLPATNWNAGAFSPDGRFFAAADTQGKVHVWDAVSWNKVHQWTLPRPVQSLAFANDSRHLALGNANGTVYLLRLAPKPAS